MTTGQFHNLEVDSIIVERHERQRRELTNIPVLADSIRRLGLIHPIVIRRDRVLVAGERRYAAVRSLGWTHISCQYVDEIEPHLLKAIELEENIKRQDVPWEDYCRAVRDYHILRKSTEPNWTQERTGEALGVVQETVSETIKVAEALLSGDKRVLDAGKLSVARGIVRRNEERKDQQQLAAFTTAAGITNDPVPADITADTILQADFNEWVLAPKGPKFNFIHCDFPYGIGADDFNQGAAPAHGGYDDSEETWERLMQSLTIATETLTTDQCHLLFWFAMRRRDQRLYEATAHTLEAMGWDINPMPLIWMKSDGVGVIPDPERGPRQIYETCFLGSRGDRKIVRAKANAYSCQTVRDKHMSEKPEPMLRHFFEMLIDEHSIVLDPTCGSGSAIRAAESLGAKFTLGLERDPEFVERARLALKQARNLRKAEKKQ